MTVLKAKPREAKQPGASVVQSYLTSLLYLREEARRDGLDAIATILWDALSAMEEWIKSGDASIDRPDVFDVSLCHALDFLLKWLALPQDRKRQIALYIAGYELGIDPGEVVAHSPPSVSKRRSN